MTVFADENEIIEALALAPERGELFLLFQPKMSFATGMMAGVEALMRWESPQFGLVHPSTFIPVAERAGLIDRITEWGICQALRQWTEWKDQGVKVNIAFNISALTLRDLGFPDAIEHWCRVEGVPCKQLTLEVTESATQHAVRLLDTITRFRIKGMGVELDDFGTGYSSLLQLRQLPYTGLKVDICFIKDAVKDPEARLIVQSVIDLAHGLGLTATAEGVEDEETLQLLDELGCDRAQGFAIAAPMRGPELIPWLIASKNSWPRFILAQQPTEFEVRH